jgi:hypothetical protein
VLLFNMFLQAGQYRFSVTPPATLPGLTVLGSPLAVVYEAGPAHGSRSGIAVTVPPKPVVGSAVTAQITLADLYGNPVPASVEAQYNNSRLTIYGEDVLHDLVELR